jgi:sulfatase modifying factor 1
LCSQPPSTPPHDDRLVDTPNRAEMVWIPGGAFLCEDLATDGSMRTAPAGAFPSNGDNLLNPIGHIWEWAADWYTVWHTADASRVCRSPEGPRGEPEADGYDWYNRPAAIRRKAVKDASYLCAPNRCPRYDPAAPDAQPIDTVTGHTGFRCAARL